MLKKIWYKLTRKKIWIKYNDKKKRYFLFCATDVFTNRSFLECQRRVSISLSERYMYLLSHGYYCNDAFYLNIF